MSTYSKLLGALVGNVVALILAYMAAKGLATCTTPADSSTCTVFGMGTTQITAGLMFVVNAAFVYFFPANATA
jgi:hypothetical protein